MFELEGKSRGVEVSKSRGGFFSQPHPPLPSSENPVYLELAC